MEELFKSENKEKLIEIDSDFGKIIGFTSDKFVEDSYLFLDKKNFLIWVSLIISKNEGKGNFLNLLNNLKALKFNFIIPNPSKRMFGISQKFGFSELCILEGTECVIYTNK